MRKLLLIAATFLTVLTSTAAVASAQVVAPAPATGFADTTFKQDACQGLTQVGGASACTADAESKIGSVLNSIVNILSMIVGVVAVIMVIIAGFKYVTSNGDSSSVSSAKNTLVYAIVGLVIVALAQSIVRYVLKQL